MLCCLCKENEATYIAKDDNLVMELCEDCVYDLSADEEDSPTTEKE